MNERMAELFGQACISDSITEEFGIEYLAELIVRECAELMEEQHTWVTNVSASKMIRTHFGVE